MALRIARRVKITASTIVSWNRVFSTPRLVRKEAWAEPKKPEPCPLIWIRMTTTRRTETRIWAVWKKDSTIR
jgi:hypothetical protein